jgi:hypothetical protein
MIILGVAVSGIILAIFLSGKFLAAQDQVAVAAQPQDNLLSARAYQFTGQGEILGGSGSIWMIGGVPIIVNNQTQVENGLHPGDAVSVLGQISKDGKWLADRISAVADQDSFFSFGGPLERRTSTAWQIAGITLQVNDQTQFGASIQDNELVVATFKVMPDGTWLALKIESLSEVAANPTPTVAQSTDAQAPTINEIQIVSDQSSSVSDQKSPAIKPAGKGDKSPACEKPNGKGKGRGHDPCPGAGGGDKNKGDD